MSFDFDHAVQAPFRMQPGLRRLADDAPPPLTPLRPGARHLREKLAVLQHWPEQALLCRSGFDADPALHHLADEAARLWPQAFAVTPEGHWQARWLGCSLTAHGEWRLEPTAWPELGQVLLALPPEQRRAGLLALAFAEDLALVDGTDASLPWLAVCLPSHWAPRDKLGRGFAEVHAPVADADLLRQAGAHLMAMVCAPQRWERFVWTITGSPWLHAHPDRLPGHEWPAELQPGAPGQAWWRTERQSFIPLPALRQAVFTIHVRTQPLAQAIACAAQAQRLHDSLASMSPAVLAYRGLSAVQAPLLAWLRQQASQA